MTHHYRMLEAFANGISLDYHVARSGRFSTVQNEARLALEEIKHLRQLLALKDPAP